MAETMCFQALGQLDSIPTGVQPHREGAVVHSTPARFRALVPVAVVSLAAETRAQWGVLRLARAAGAYNPSLYCLT
jgi:hypothetical protein